MNGRGRRRVAVTGLGVVSPFGRDVDAFFEALLAGRSAVTLYEPADQPSRLSVPAVHCPDFDANAALGRPLASLMDRFAHLGVAAAFDAWRDAGLSADGATPPADGGVHWGSALGGTMTFERGYRELFLNGRERVSPMTVAMGMLNAAASHIAIRLGLGAACLNSAVACASSAVAIGDAFRRVRDGEATLMLTGGSDAPLSFGVVRAWEAMRVLAGGDAASAPRACRPFDASRAGLVLGEGAAALVLEDWDHAVARGARIHAEMVGHGTSSDHVHLVRPDADGQVRALAGALADAGLSADDVDYVNAHGTGTLEGDAIEIEALRRLFGARAPGVAVSATKSMHGHQMGATGAVEAVVTVLALRSGHVPPTAHLQDVDPACDGVQHIRTALRGRAPRVALSNSFAFGGSNAVLAFRAVS